MPVHRFQVSSSSHELDHHEEHARRPIVSIDSGIFIIQRERKNSPLLILFELDLFLQPTTAVARSFFFFLLLKTFFWYIKFVIC
jgi:hypothetical protein